MKLTNQVNTNGFLYRTITKFCEVFDCEPPETSCGYFIKGVITGYCLIALPIAGILGLCGATLTPNTFVGITTALGVMLVISVSAVTVLLLALLILVALGTLLIFGTKPFTQPKNTLVPLGWTKPFIKTYKALHTLKQKWCKPLNKT